MNEQHRTDNQLSLFNEQCRKCISDQIEHFGYADYSHCSTCHIGNIIHSLDKDNVDSNSERYSFYPGG